jgi:hypothetical protein
MQELQRLLDQLVAAGAPAVAQVGETSMAAIASLIVSHFATFPVTKAPG